jgi:phosphoglycerate mutase, putative
VEAAGGGNALVVSHSMTIGTFAYLIDKAISKNPEVDNGSVTVVEYEKGQFTIQILGDVSYREVGAKILDAEMNS